MSSRSRRRPLGATLLLAVAVALAVLGAPGTIAFLSAQAGGPTASVTTGSASLSVSAVPAQTAVGVHPGGPAESLHPSAAPRVTNTGTVPLAVSVSPSVSDANPGPFARAVAIVVLLQDAATCAPAPAKEAWVGAVDATSGVLAVLPPGAAKTVCAWQRLPIDAPDGSQGQTASFTLTLTGAQQ